MSTKTKKLRANRKTHDRSAMIQWLAIGLVVALGLAAILILTDATGYGGGHSGALTVLRA